MRTITHYRLKIGIMILFGFLIVTSIRTLNQTLRFNPNVIASQHVAPLESALEPLDEQLPEDEIIGYLGDPQLPAGEYTRLYYAMQYGLAPHVVRMIGPIPSDLYNQTSDAELAVLEHMPPIVLVYNPNQPRLQTIVQRLGLIEIQPLNGSVSLFCRADAVNTSDCPFRGQ